MSERPTSLVIHEALAEVFDADYHALSPAQQQLVQRDLSELYDEDPKCHPTYRHAARELKLRIGGHNNLLPYVRTLEGR